MGKPKLLSVGVSFALFVLGGCASVEPSNPEAAASDVSFGVAEDRSRIYVFRDDNVVLNTPISVSIDGKPVGVTGNKTHVVATVQPGPHTVSAKGENTDELGVETVGGEIVFVEIGVGLGVIANRAKLAEVDPERGREAVRKTRPVN